MFKQSKWEAWYDSLPESTKKYIDNQAVWHDRDMFKAAAFGAVVGLLIGLLF